MNNNIIKRRSFVAEYDNNFFYLSYKYHYHFFHSLIYRGRKLWAFKFFNNLKYSLKQNEALDPNFVFFVAITNLAPEVLLFPLKRAGIINQVPMPISNKKQIIYAVKWIIKLLRDKYSILTLKNTTDLLLDSLKNVGLAVDKKKAIHVLAKNNRYLLKYFK